MSITLEYEPDKGISYNGKFIPWKTTRKLTRELLQGQYKSRDLEFEGISSHRDIYSGLDGKAVFLFLNFDENDHFFEMEIHDGVELSIYGRSLSFDLQFLDAVDILDEISSEQRIVDEGEILFVDLKLSVCSGASMGGDQENTRLSYIYCAKDIEHLME